MSIETEIKRQCSEERLIEFEDPQPEGPATRTLYLSPALAEKIDGTNDVGFEKVRFWGMLRADFELYVSGELSVRPPGGSHENCKMAPLDPPPDDVWEIRSVEKRGIRVVGHFAAPDVFVALEWEWRERLGAYGSKEWLALMSACRHHWGRLFPYYDPWRSEDYPNGFLSFAYLAE